MAEVKKPTSAGNNSTFLLLSLGVLVGFLLGFVLLLANLPGYENLGTYDAKKASEFKSSGKGFEFYSLLSGVSSDSSSSMEVYTPKLPAVRSRNQTQDVEAEPEIYEVPASYNKDAYFLQAGSFRNKSDAEKMRAKLLLNGLDAFVKSAQTDGQKFHRVRIGPYYDLELLDQARTSLKTRGISYMVLRVRG